MNAPTTTPVRPPETVDQKTRQHMWSRLAGTYLLACSAVKAGGEAGRLAWADVGEALRLLQRAAGRRGTK